MNEVLVGHCGVDSGQVWIGDPCYVMDDSYLGQPSEPTGGKYDTCCRVTLSDQKAGEAASGVVTATNYGDGIYPVYVTYDEDNRPTELRIVFVQEKDPGLCDYCETDGCGNGCPCECDCSCNKESGGNG